MRRELGFVFLSILLAGAILGCASPGGGEGTASPRLVIKALPDGVSTVNVTVDLVAGEDQDVPVAMSLSETKLLIPDGSNNRLVQIDDLNGSGWTTVSGLQLGCGADLGP